MMQYKVGDTVCNTLKGQFRYNTLGRVEEYDKGLYLVRWGDGERNWIDPSILAAKETRLAVCGSPVGSGTGLDVDKADAVNSPKHYQFFPDLEAIEVIARSMTQEQFYGYCLGNRLKYRLRAGNKDKLEQDIAKSDKYSELYEQHRGKCIAAE